MLRLRGSVMAGRAAARAAAAVARPAAHRPTSFSVRKHIYTASTSSRGFSSGSDKFRETLENIKKKAAEKNSEEEQSAVAAGEAAGEARETDSAADAAAKEKQGEAAAPDYGNMFRKTTDFATDAFVSLKDNVRMAWDDLTGASKQTTLRRSVIQAESFRRGGEPREEDPDAVQYDGPTAIVVVKDRGSAWDQMKARLSSSPLIREMLKNSKKVKDAAASTDIGKKAFETGQNVRDKMEDVREYWETSQNPLVYKISGVWDSLTGETEEGIAISEICKLDPNFIKEDWSEEVRSTVVPLVINCHLRGDLTDAKPWLGEAVYNKLSADIKARKADGITFDTNVLEIDENTTIIRLLEGEGAVVVVIYMVQQINCIRNKEGDIIEGAEDQVRAKFYSIAFKQVYNEDDGLVQWTVVDYEFAGDIPYL